MPSIFISDLHLAPNTEEKNQIFYKLMQEWQGNIDALYILGDFFDYWVGDDDKNSFTQEMKSIFREFTKTTPIYFLVGNHDFAIGKIFVRETGITLLKDCTTVSIFGKKILLSHGDVFCTLDVQYQKMKKILRNPLLIYLLRKTPLQWRYRIKDKLEHKSSGIQNTKPQETYQVVQDTVIYYAHKHKVNCIIHGHTHNPNIYKIKDADSIIERVEIPDWRDRAPGGYVSYDGQSIKIHTV